MAQPVRSTTNLQAVRDVVLSPRRGRQTVAQGVSPGIDDLPYNCIKAPEGRRGSSMAEGPCRPSGAEIPSPDRLTSPEIKGPRDDPSSDRRRREALQLPVERRGNL